jgi:hypothetical protein
MMIILESFREIVKVTKKISFPQIPELIYHVQSFKECNDTKTPTKPSPRKDDREDLKHNKFCQ